MIAQEIVKFVKENIEPLPPAPPAGERYRVSAKMTDGTYPPCVVIESTDRRVDLAIRRFEESRTEKNPNMGYRPIVANFVARGNRINDFDIEDLAPSPFAIPLARLREVRGETSMGWTAFTAIMKDGKGFHFGTTYLMEFFDLPEGYSGADIQKIIPAPRGESPQLEGRLLAKPFFTCYVNGL